MSSTALPAATADSMRAYYARRAASYERVYDKPERQADLQALKAWLPERFAGRHGLEIACGTGYWTPFAAAHCASWLATDANEEVMAIARTKPLPPGRVQFRLLDAYDLSTLGDTQFDAALAAFWWSHVPRQRLPGWLASLHARLAPGARVVMLDNTYVPGSNHPITRQDAEGNTYQTRALDDGSTHEVLKNFPTREQAFAMLGAHARDPQWTVFQHYWALSYTLH
jgi:demethylmenaquinone methyltransferase/2-methoxy-6-polyprenyl-1,4-benzoquinol methylase